MAEKTKAIKMVTEVGTLVWPKVNTEIDEYKGKKKYVVRLELPDKSEKKLIADLQKLYKEAQDSPEYKGKEWRHKPRLGFKPDKKTGKIQFTFWTYAFNKDKEGNETDQKIIPVYNKFGQVISDKTIGHGSTGQISFNPSVYNESEDANGITLYLRQIVVHDLVEFGGSSPDFEFETFVPGDDEEEPFED